MDNVNDLFRDLNLCINAINKDLISKDNIEAEIAYIQIQSAIILTNEWISKALDVFEEYKYNGTIDEVEFYVYMMEYCSFIYEDIKAVEKRLYKDGSLSMEDYNVIFRKLARILSILNSLVKEEKSLTKLMNFCKYVIDKYYQFSGDISNRLNGKKNK